tara:strand:- start:566 stop:745 length:180 start_codon:yes stop_codon:yes gene_type:complete
MAFKMKMKGFPKVTIPQKPKSMMEAKKKPYKKPVEAGYDEPEKIAYSRRVLNPTIKNPR